MADRYWVGGDGTWDATSTANWAASSGGVGGASVPTASDNVFFDANSGASYNLVQCISSICANFNTTGYPGHLAYGPIVIYGNLVNGSSVVNGASMTLSGTGSQTITTSGNTFDNIIINSNGGNYALTDALYCANLYVQSGSFATANYNINLGSGTASISATGSSLCAITLGSSTVTIPGTGTLNITFSAGSNFVFSAGTSTITSTTVKINTTNSSSVARTFYNVTSTSATVSLAGTNTFNNVTVATDLSISGTQTISGALSLVAGTVSARQAMTSLTPGTRSTISVNSFTVTPVYWDFADIGLTGAVAPLSGAYLGDCGNNSGITFSSPKTVYWVGGTGTWTSSTSWATSSGGSPAIANVPLAQDSVVIDDNSGASGMTVSVAGVYVTSINSSARSVPASISVSTSPAIKILGNVQLSSSCSLYTSGDYYVQLSGRSAQTIQSNGATINCGVSVASIASSVSLNDACAITTPSGYTFSAGSLMITSGTFNSNNYSLTITTTNSGVSSLYMAGAVVAPITFAIGTSTVSMTRGVSIRVPVTFTGVSTGVLKFTTSNAKTFASGAFRNYFPKVDQGGSGTITFTGSARFYNLTNSYKSTGATTIRFTGNTLNTFDVFDLAGEATRLCTLNSTLTTTRAALKMSSGAAIDVGSTSTNAGNNYGVLFSGAGPSGYLSVSYINSVAGQSGFLMM